MQRERKLYLCICDFNKNVVCDLYDNQSDISGQATNVVISTERNGWKELTFDIPSTCFSEEGEVPNYRLDYLVAEYRIRAVTDKETDWFVISEPQIKRSAFSKNVSVKAGHIAQLLKHKNLDLEFSDDEGNNVGSCDKLLETILEGTGWQPGYVETFLEDNGNIKARSLSAQAGAGALSLIDKLCDLFDAKPIYHGDTKTVDIISMNPFAKIDPERIPYKLLEDENSNIIELHYNRNIHSLTKTVNTDNMATRLYAYGSSGDMNGTCSLQTAMHNEWMFECIEVGTEYRFDIGDVSYFFTGDVSLNDELVWSDMDITSMSYIYNNTKEEAYRVSKKPSTSNYKYLTETNVEEVQNYVAFILGLKYYDDVGLMSEEQFQETAKYQREIPELLKTVIEKSEAFTESEATLEDLASHGNGLLKLKISNYIHDGRQFIIDTSEGDGVEWRTDYMNAERRYFMWHVTDQLNNYDDPVTGTPSMLLIIHKTENVTFDMVYLKEIWDVNGELVVDSKGNPGDFTYTTGDYPTKFSVWTDVPWTATDEVYLFCTNSITGKLGGKLSCAEGIERTLFEKTAMYHPVIFTEETPYPAPADTEYQWLYKFNRHGTGILNFCWKDKYPEDIAWRQVYIGTSFPDITRVAYFYNTRTKALYKKLVADGAWTKIEDKQTIVAMFDSVINQCYERDKQYQGLYEYYTRNGALTAGNYAVHDEHNAFWLFKLKDDVASNILIDTTDANAYVYSDVTWNNDKPVYSDIVSTTKSIGDTSPDPVEYPSSNIISGITFYPGSIDPTTGIEVNDAYYRTGFIDAIPEKIYTYSLPIKSAVVLYNEAKEFISYLECPYVEGEQMANGTFTTTSTTAYIRITMPTTNRNMYCSYYDATQSLTVDILKDRPLVPGGISETGQDEDVTRYRTYTIQVHENTQYQYYFEYDTPISVFLYEYDINYKFIKETALVVDSDAHAGYITTSTNAALIRLVCTSQYIDDASLMRESNYDKKLYYAADGHNKEAYYILGSIEKLGELVGIYNLINRFSKVANDTYNVYLKDMQDAQQEEKDRTNELASLLDDMLKDGRWQDSNYIKGDEKRLYDDAMYMLRQISMPEINYSFTYLDLKDSKLDVCPCDRVDEFPYPDVDITYVAHLIDEESNSNCWAYIDKTNICYDQSWKTTIEIDTKLTLAARHGFTDVIARIAEVAKEINAKQSLYDQAIKSKVDGSKLQGVIDLNQVYLNSGESNWYNDNNGNLVFEALDGLSAMMLSGRGLGISTTKLQTGDWEWRTAATGYGLTADVITTGFLSADRIEAGSITANKLSSTLGQELEISSNKALALFATEDGSRPAGSLKTTDGYIEIIAGIGTTPAKINIVSGGELNLNGGNIRVHSNGTLDVSSGGVFTLSSNGATITDAGTGLFIGSESGVNFANLFKVIRNGNTVSLSAIADKFTIGTEDSSGNVTQGIQFNAADSAMYIKTNNTINIDANKTLTLVSGGNVVIGNGSKAFTVGGNSTRAYIYNTLSSMDGTNAGVYLGTDGLHIRSGANSYIKAFANGELDISGKITATSGSFTGTVTATSGSFTGEIIAKSGKIGNMYISSTENTGTTEQGGHFYVNSLYTHFADDEFQYEAGLKGDPTWNTNLVFYVKKTTAGARWLNNSSTTLFSVNNIGELYAQNADITGTITANALYIGNNNIISDGKISLTSDTFAGIGTTTSAIQITDTGISVRSGGSIDLTAATTVKIGWGQISNKPDILTIPAGIIIAEEQVKVYSGDNYINITPNLLQAIGSEIKLQDSTGNNSVEIKNNGITIVGNRITIKDPEKANEVSTIWGRDDIIVMNANETDPTKYWRKSIAGIEDHMHVGESDAKHDWVLIKPYYDSQISYDTGTFTDRQTPIAELSIPKQDEASFGDNADGYSYDFSIRIRRTQTAAPSLYMNIYARNGTAYRKVIRNEFALEGGVQFVENDTYNLLMVTSKATHDGDYYTFDFAITAGTGANHNLCGENYSLYMDIYAVRAGQTTGFLYLESVTMTANCNATDSRVPCTVYYYP